ncbi:MAG: cytochrome c3 family protein, partial [Actinomycetota bacterium]
MTKHQSNQIKKIRAGLLVIFFCLVSSAIFYSRTTPKNLVTNAEISSTPRPKKKVQTRNARYSEFPHNKHKLACSTCHNFPSANWKSVRKTDAFPDITDYPRHESCLNCHRQQFFKGAKPQICSICHTNPSPNDSSRHPFPNPREIFDQS